MGQTDDVAPVGVSYPSVEGDDRSGGPDDSGVDGNLDTATGRRDTVNDERRRPRSRRRGSCPACAEFVRFVPIVYGYPMPETFEAADRGEVILGGCIVFDLMPEARCPSCLTDLRWTGETWTPVGQRAER